MFRWHRTIRSTRAGAPQVELAFTDRAPGLGERPYRGFNLGGHVGDDPGAVEANRAALSAALGVPRARVVFMRQVHGTAVARVDGPWSPDAVPEADGIVTTSAGLGLVVLVADCVPVLLHDVQAGVVGAVHAGRHGMIGRIVDVALDRMHELGARRVSAAVGPSVCGRCYEVPPDLADTAASVSTASAARSWTGTPAIDVAAGVVEQLAAREVAVEWLAGCTREDDRLYSYRRDGTTGRFAGVVLLRDAAAARASDGRSRR